ncbi:MAG TPA: helix-turn-helix transcriptional regulator [Acetobacteraceae bacterium]|nr:helix-turn-helix transcriptional regulator [Acetobacteraceae bacterium]
MADAKKMMGTLVRTLRQKKNLTQVELAAEVGVSRPMISNIERGKFAPGRDTMAALADVLGVSLDELRRGLSDEAPSNGEFVKDPDELAWLHFWRGLTEEQRELVVRMLAEPPRQKRRSAA